MFSVPDTLRKAGDDLGFGVREDEAVEELVLAESDLLQVVCPAVPSAVGFLVGGLGFCVAKSVVATPIEEIQDLISLGTGQMRKFSGTCAG